MRKLTHEEVGKLRISVEESKTVKRNPIYVMCDNIRSIYNDQSRKLEGYYAIPYPISKGCTAAYFPETNALTSINDTCGICETPAYKSVRVRVEKAAG